MQDERGLLNSTYRHMTGWSPCAISRAHQGLQCPNIIIIIWPDKHNIVTVSDWCGVLWDIQEVQISSYFIMRGEKGSIAVGQNHKCILLSIPWEWKLFLSFFLNWNRKYTFVKLLTTYLITEEYVSVLTKIPRLTGRYGKATTCGK